MERKIITTGDGSKTIHMPDWNEQYHSKHGALQEALHVFIEMGLRFSLSRKRTQSQPISILEYGLGTGLNAMITAQFNTEIPIHYTGVEAFPVSMEEAHAMQYGELLNDKYASSRFYRRAIAWSTRKTRNVTSDEIQLTNLKYQFSIV